MTDLEARKMCAEAEAIMALCPHRPDLAAGRACALLPALAKAMRKGAWVHLLVAVGAELENGNDAEAVRLIVERVRELKGAEA